MYQIIDIRTKLPVGKPYTSRNRAYARADKLDQAHGAVRYIVQTLAK